MSTKDTGTALTQMKLDLTDKKVQFYRARLCSALVENHVGVHR